MKLQDIDEANNESGDRKSFLFGLWRRKAAAGRGRDGREPEPEVLESELVLEPEPVSFEKTDAPEALARLYVQWQQQQGDAGVERVLVSDVCVQPYPEEKLLKSFLAQIEIGAQRFLNQYEALCRQNKELIEKYIAQHGKTEEGEKTGAGVADDAVKADRQLQNPAAELEILPPLDGEVLVYTSPDWNSAWCMVLPPLGSGKCATVETIRDALKKKGVTFGLLEERIEELATENGCLKIMPVALGRPATRGEDGRVIEHFSRDIGQPHFIEDAQGIIDFENLNWLVPIEKGTVICDVVLPTMGEPGKDVRGRDIKPYNGKKPLLPMGDNVVLNEENTALVARISGQIAYKNKKYHVANTITIPGNVDLSTGSLNVRGDLIISGNVLAGFTVQASGDITIGGIVEGSQVTAGGSIIVNRGMNGNLVGTLNAGKDIHCKYMENASIYANGDVYMESIVNSDISCNGRLVVRSGRGVIIGGTALVMGGIDAKIIGNRAGRLTVLSIGPTMQFLREKEQAEKELESVEFELKKAQMTVTTGKTALNQRILELKQSKLKQTLQELEEREARVVRSRVRADKLYPIVQVSINSIVKSLIEPCLMCSIYLDTQADSVAVTTR